MPAKIKIDRLVNKNERKEPAFKPISLDFNRSRQPKISVVIPTLNEEKNLPYVLPVISEMVHDVLLHEVLLIDGYSEDKTVEMARQLCPEIRVVMQEGRGKGAALRTGFAAATGDIIIMLDADGSTAPSEIPAYVGALLSGADFAKGSRFLQGGGTADMSLFRMLGNWVFVLMVRLLYGGSYTDLCYGYNAFWKKALPVLNLDCDGFEIETLMNVRALRFGLRVAEVPSYEYRRVFGEGRLRAIPDGWRVLKTIIKEIFVGVPAQVPSAEQAMLIPQTGDPNDAVVSQALTGAEEE